MKSEKEEARRVDRLIVAPDSTIDGKNKRMV